MVLANPADPYQLQAKVIAWNDKGERLESYSTRFLKVVITGTPKDTPADVYNSYIRPISDYLSIPKVVRWQKKMLALEKQYARNRRRVLKTKSYGKSFAGAK